MSADLAEFKKALHSEMQDAVMTLLPRYFEKLSFTEDAEELRKGLAFMVQTVGAEAEKRQDPYGNLPVVNITFTNGTVATQTTLPVIEISAEELAHLNPTEVMRDHLTVNADVMDEC